MSQKQTKTTVSQQSQSEEAFFATDHCKPSDEKVAKRGDWEAFDYRLLDNGNVEVVNKSHGDEEAIDHTYVVVMDERGVPKWCLKKPAEDEGEWEDCPARKYHCSHEPKPTSDEKHEVCKHSWAVAQNDVIVQAVRAQKQRDD